MRRILGSNLSPTLQREALSRFAHRYTGDHKPKWAQQPMPSGKPFPVQFASDQDWLASTLFWVTDRNTLAKRHPCESRPTWPNGKGD